ncbi:MAG: hypothetical protein U5L72_01950 [Bacteroidales bacterium]|nr:hypothetical protein [Bacteroidales bacterium]
MVYTAQLGGVNSLIVGLLAAGAVSAAFSTVPGLLWQEPQPFRMIFM